MLPFNPDYQLSFNTLHLAIPFIRCKMNPANLLPVHICMIICEHLGGLSGDKVGITHPIDLIGYLSPTFHRLYTSFPTIVVL